MGMKPKIVIFNTDNKLQKELYDYAMSLTNFSGYMRDLLMRDMLGVPPRENVSHEPIEGKFDANSLI